MISHKIHPLIRTIISEVGVTPEYVVGNYVWYSLQTNLKHECYIRFVDTGATTAWIWGKGDPVKIDATLSSVIMFVDRHIDGNPEANQKWLEAIDIYNGGL
jgi:hypothetical protein